jgi:hypothetical protein
MRQLAKPAAAAAMDANRASDQREKLMAEMMDLCRHSARRIVELTEVVADLQERITQLEAVG